MAVIDTSEHPHPQPRFRVRYYDRRLSRKGRGVQVRRFVDRAKADAFAAANQIYSQPCRVEEIAK